jgi:uncharacterized membrane protein YoaK (UPF0700 family)
VASAIIEPAATRGRSGLAVVLGSVGGFVDGVGFVALFGLFIAHMSGNSTHVGVAVGTSAWSDAVAYGFPIVAFVVAVTIGALLVDTLSARQVHSSLAVLLAVEVVLLIVLQVLGAALDQGDDLVRNTPSFFLLVGVAVGAMGLQTATLRRVGAVPIHTTFVTGMLATVGIELAAVVRAREPSARREGWSRARLAGGVWLAYLAGAVTGVFLHDHLRLWALAVPTVALAVASVLAYRWAEPADA